MFMIPPCYNAGDTVYFGFFPFDSNGGSVTITGLAVTDIEIMRCSDEVERTSDVGYTLLDTDGIDLKGHTGIHGFKVDTSSNAHVGFWADGNTYFVVVDAVTIDSQTVRLLYLLPLGLSLKPTTAGRTLTVSANGEANADLTFIHGTALTETATQLAGAFTKFFDVASPTGTVNSLPDAAPGVVGGGLTLAQQAGYPTGCVWFDTQGAAGAVSYVNGIVTNPSSSPTNTHTLLGNLNLKVVRVVNASNYTAEATYTGVSFIGEKWNFFPSGQQMINCYFEGATITSGTFHANSTGCQFTKCKLSTVTLPAGATAAAACTLRECGLSGTFTIGAAGIFTFDNCYSEGAAGTDWVLDFAAVGATTINLAGFSGPVEVRNMAAGDVLVVDGAGKMTLTAPCAGTLYLRGSWELVPGTATTTINDSSRWNEDQTVTWNAAWDAEVESECNDAMVALNLDHLLKVALADDGDIVNDTALAQVMATDGDFTGYSKGTDSLEALRDNIAGQCVAALSAYTAPTLGQLQDRTLEAAGYSTATALAVVDGIADAILAMLDDARGEPGQGTPPVNADAMTKLDYIYKAWRNKSDQNSTTYQLYADDASTVDQKATVSDDGTTATKGEIATGP
jgi:hypothetical protein